MFFKYFFPSVLFLLFAFEQASACDPCALYSVSRLEGLSSNSYTLSISEQFTSYERVDSERFVGRNAEVTNAYSTTQLAVGYDLSDRIGLQLNAPFVYRTFDRIRDYRSSDGTETGLGDVSLQLNTIPYAVRDGMKSFLFSFSAGVKLPTGDSGAIDNSLEPGRSRAVPGSVLHHDVAATGGLGGRILSLGTGSTDFILSSGLMGRIERVLLSARVQYGIRTEGDFNYRFNNDLILSGGPGYYLLLDDAYALAFQGVLTAELKDEDRLNGSPVSGSRVRNIYVGPSFLFSAKSKYVSELALDIPTSTERQDANIVPDYRLRLSFTYRF